MKKILKYSRPAPDYINGLPIGNGRLAAMVCGDARHVRLALNHEWLWRGDNRFRDCDDVSDKLPEVREALLSGDFLRGTELANKYFAGKGGISGERNRVDPYQPAGDLTVTAEAGEYRRRLDLSTGEASVTIGAATVRAFASFADGFIVCGVNGSASFELSRVPDNECVVDVRGLELSGRFRSGTGFEIRGREYCRGDSVTVLVDIATDAGGGALLPFPEEADYDTLFARHVDAFRRAFGPSEVDIPLPESELDTDLRLELFRQGQDPGLLMLYYEYGRYLMVSGSSGELPLNLQGKWNEALNPPWESDYHLDVNLQMAYWATETLRMFRQQDTLFNLCERYVPHGREMAKKLYGCGGTYFTLQTDVWGRMTPESMGWAVWTGAAPWLASHFAKHWRYTRDGRFLRERAYPFLKEVAAFYMDYFVERDGVLHILPSQSPENRFEGTGSYPVSIGIDCAMDIELATDTLRSCIEMAEELGVDEDLCERWKDALSKLPELTTDSLGRLNEFDRERPEPEPGHRHLSHLYGLYPGELFPEGHPLRLACERSLDSRLSHGGGHTGWSRSWVACIMARLGRTEDCFRHLTALLCDFATGSLLGLHPPRIYQIDANMGGLAAICEMLLSCEGNTVRLLGAVPEDWSTGAFRHFAATGTLDVSCAWSSDKVAEVELGCVKGGSWTVKLGGESKQVELADGERRTIRFRRS